MNSFMVKALIRVAIGIAGGFLAKMGIDSTALTSAASNPDIGVAVIGVISMVVPALWAAYAHTAAALVDKAAATAPDVITASVATAAKASASGVKTHLNK